MLDGLISGFGNLMDNVMTGIGRVVAPDAVSAGQSFRNSYTTVPSAGTFNLGGLISDVAAAVKSVAPAINVASGAVVPQYVTGTPQVLNLTTTNPGISIPGSSQVFNLPPNTISITSPVSTQGSQAAASSSSMWLIIALLALVAIALMRKG